MDFSLRVRRFAALLVLIAATAPLAAESPQFVCWPIVRGDTASGLARRLTGDAATRHTPSFEIRDPARGIFVPKSRYDYLRTEWQACVAQGVPAAVVLPPPEVPRPRSQPYNAALAWQVGVAVALFLFASSMAARYADARPIPPAMRHAAEQFVRDFARPLLDPSSNQPPIKVRLRFVRQTEQLEICIAPTAGHRYPNLSDHKQNVEYDVDRVVRQLRTPVVVSDRLRAEGEWVIVPIRHVDLKQAGAK